MRKQKRILPRQTMPVTIIQYLQKHRTTPINDSVRYEIYTRLKTQTLIDREIFKSYNKSLCLCQ